MLKPPDCDLDLTQIRGYEAYEERLAAMQNLMDVLIFIVSRHVNHQKNAAIARELHLKYGVSDDSFASFLIEAAMKLYESPLMKQRRARKAFKEMGTSLLICVSTTLVALLAARFSADGELSFIFAFCAVLSGCLALVQFVNGLRLRAFNNRKGTE